MRDILEIIGNLCVKFQNDQVNYSSMFKSIDVCIKEIKENYVNKNEYGENYNKF